MKIKKFLLFLVLESILVVLFVRADSTFFLKLSGGVGFLKNGGDLKRWMESRSADWKDWGMQGSWSYEFSSLISEPTLEAGIKIISPFSVCLGVGYLPKKWTETYDASSPFEAAGNRTTWTEKIQLDIVPLTFSGLLSFPISIADINIQGGIGYYAAKFKYSMSGTELDPNRLGKPKYQWTFSETFESSRIYKLGYHFDLGLDFNLSSQLSISVDAFYRKVDFTDIKGTKHYKSEQTWVGGSEFIEGSESDVIWILENIPGPAGETRYHLEFWNHYDPPDKPFLFSLDGIFLRAGLKIRF